MLTQIIHADRASWEEWEWEFGKYFAGDKQEVVAEKRVLKVWKGDFVETVIIVVWGEGEIPARKWAKKLVSHRRRTEQKSNPFLDQPAADFPSQVHWSVIDSPKRMSEREDKFIIQT